MFGRITVAVASAGALSALAWAASLPGVASDPLVGREFYSVDAQFMYRGQLYKRRWVHACDTYVNRKGGGDRYGKSAWGGFATALPDGSAVLFRPRDEVCAPSWYGLALLGPGYEGAPRFVRPGREAYGEAARIPAIYWFDRASNPTRVEACLFRQCAEAPSARVRLLDIRGAPIEGAPPALSNPAEAIPALAPRPFGLAAPKTFIGYACWRLPTAAVQKAPYATPAKIARMVSLPSGFDRAQQVSDALKVGGYFLAGGRSWSLSGLAFTPSLKPHGADPYALGPEEAAWRRQCNVDAGGAAISPQPESSEKPIVMTPLRRSGPPTTVVTAAGKLVPAGGPLDGGDSRAGFIDRTANRLDHFRFSNVVQEDEENIDFIEAHTLPLDAR